MVNRAEDDARVTAAALAAGRGDRRALESFVRETQRDVWRFVAHLESSAFADDLTQETYLRAVPSLARFEARSSARSWLFSIARRVVVDHVRALSVRPRLTDAADWVAAAELARTVPGATFEDAVELDLLLAALPPERREALVLTQLLGFSYQEAAEVCGCPVGTIRSRIARAREDLVAATRPNRRDETG